MVDNLDIIVTCQPMYGSNSCLVRWTIPPGWEDADWFVYRSPSGVGDWKALNREPATPGEFYDDDLSIKSKFDTAYYRLIGERMVDGVRERIRSAPAGFFDHLTRKDYGVVRRMMHNEVRMLQRTGGIQVLHYQPLTHGQPNPAFDPDTQQKLGSCKDDQGFGQRFIGGFGPPRWTWIKLLRRGPQTKRDNPDGTGPAEQTQVTARFPAFPWPRKGHLIVHVPTDDRFVVASVLDPHRLDGIVPISFTVQLELLRRDDTRYKVPLPDDAHAPPR